MKLAKKNVVAGSSEAALVKQVYEEAFPEVERYAFDTLLELCRDGNATLDAYYDGSDFVGFSFILERNDYVYLFYFATVPEKRSKGYGSHILKALLESVAGQTVVLDIEPIDVDADNIGQRRRRAQFYEKLGFAATSAEMTDLTGNYRVYTNRPETFDVDTFRSLWDIFPEAFDGTVLLKK